ncbi:TPA: hypothetical protein HA265_01835, partial [Candidatus Woesearchaeota archaeon]|nr:hypothetical protein [Candidatus Woesearchaeota archaeon]
VCSNGIDCDGGDPFVWTDCDNGCFFDEDSDGFGFGCDAGLDCNGMHPFTHTGCFNNCLSDNDGDGYGWKCDSGADCNDTHPYINLDCTATTRCKYDHDGDGYGLGCEPGPDCDDYDDTVFDDCPDNCTYDLDCNGLPDEWQEEYFNNTICDDPLYCGPDADPDGDGYSNIEEYRRDTNPLEKEQLPLAPERPAEEIDDDGDGMPDACERMYGLDATDPYDAGDDPDGDGLTNSFECQYTDGMCYSTWLNPTSPDTDNDGYSDSEEIDAATDPCDPESHPSAGMLPLIMIILGILLILGSTNYFIYKKYYVPLVSPPPKPTAVPRVAAPAARGAGRPLPGAGTRLRHLPPRRPAGPAVSRDMFEKELKKRAQERERILSAFGERKALPKKPRKIMEEIARRPEAVRHVPVARPATKPSPKVPSKEDHVERLSKVVGKDYFDKIEGLTKEEADYFERLAGITKKKEVPLEEDQGPKLAAVTKKVVGEDKETKKELVEAFKKSDMDKLDDFLTTRKQVKTFIKEAEKEDDTFDTLSSLSSLSKQKRKDVIDALDEITSKKAKETAMSKMEKLSDIESKEDVLKAFKQMSGEKHVDKNVFEVLLSYLMKSGKITKHDVSEILFGLEAEGVLDKKDVAEVFFNLGIKK